MRARLLALALLLGTPDWAYAQGAQDTSGRPCYPSDARAGCAGFGGTIGTVKGTATTQSAATYTFAATDCGTTVFFTSNAAVTATIPASIVPIAGVTCIIGVVQAGTAKVSVNGSAVTPATLISAHSFTGTQGNQGAAIDLTLTTISASANAYLTGDGS